MTPRADGDWEKTWVGGGSARERGVRRVGVEVGKVHGDKRQKRQVRVAARLRGLSLCCESVRCWGLGRTPS